MCLALSNGSSETVGAWQIEIKTKINVRVIFLLKMNKRYEQREIMHNFIFKTFKGFAGERLSKPGKSNWK